MKTRQNEKTESEDILKYHEKWYRVNQAQNKKVVLKADRDLFGHMVIASQSRDLHVKDVLAHPLGLLSWAASSWLVAEN